MILPARRPVLTLYFYHDPMCSWCWAYRPTSDELFASLPDRIHRVNILGGLAPDTDDPMPQTQQVAIAGYWRRIHTMLGTEFNFEFWDRCEPRRSTYPACRAVIAAGRQHREEYMVDAIQRAYYIRALNPSDLSTLQLLAGELGLDTERFTTDIQSSALDAELLKQVRFAARSPISGFPSLVLEVDNQLHEVRLDYQHAGATLQHIDELAGAAG